MFFLENVSAYFGISPKFRYVTFYPFSWSQFEKQTIYGIKERKYLSLPGSVIKSNILQRLDQEMPSLGLSTRKRVCAWAWDDNIVFIPK